MKKDEILEFLQTHKKELKLLGIERIGIFGSYAKNNNTSNSDLDVLVKFGKVDSKFKAYFNTLHYLEDTLKIKVDLCREEDLKQDFKQEIFESTIYV
ncbi:MAG: nucleotidyltransferase domain-containing protein [Candidatus Cloacimonetes bacterium]|jgi:hypothetical protein|nr:nucleotidyltransferase domain-containing protein [Candidatus Cloacimonadota bacterium]